MEDIPEKKNLAKAQNGYSKPICKKTDLFFFHGKSNWSSGNSGGNLEGIERRKMRGVKLTK